MVSTIETNQDMKAKLQYSNDIQEFVFDPYPARDSESYSKVSPSVMLSRLLLSGSGEVMRVEEPLRVYPLILDEETVSILNDRYADYGRTFEVGQKVKAVKDGNTRLEALLLGIANEYPHSDIPYIQLSKEQLSDAIYMASLPIVLNQSSAKMGAYDTAKTYLSLLEALYDRVKVEASEENEDQPDDSQLRQAAKTEFLDLVSDVSPTVLDTVEKLFNKEVDSAVVEALNDGQISLVNALQIVNKAKSFKRSQIEILEKSFEVAAKRGNYLSVINSEGDEITIPHAVDRDVTEALDYFSNQVQSQKAESKIDSGEIELPEFLKVKYQEKAIPANTAQVLAGLAEESNVAPEELYEKLVETASDTLGDDFTPEKLTPAIAKKAKQALVREKAKAAKEAAKPPEEPKEPKAAKEPKKSLEDMSSEEIVYELEIRIQDLNSTDWSAYLLDKGHPDLATQYKSVMQIYNKMLKLKSNSEEEEEQVPFEEEKTEQENVLEETATV